MRNGGLLERKFALSGSVQMDAITHDDDDPFGEVDQITASLMSKLFLVRGFHTRGYHQGFSNGQSCFCQYSLHEADYTFGLCFWPYGKLWDRMWCCCSPRLPMNISSSISLVYF